MKTIIAITMLSVVAYSSVGALMQTVEAQKAHAEKINNSMLTMK
jgi:hypothetical protein